MSPRHPSVVAIGGGHGLAATLRALRRLPVSPTAVVSVADDGGSSGRLRAERRRAAPGDLRKCLVALAGEPSPLSRAMEHRYADGELAGHALGNLLLAALEDSEGGLVAALKAVGGLLGTTGAVLPVTTGWVELVGRLGDGTEVAGQTALVDTPGIDTVVVAPEVAACKEAVAAIEEADAVVLGPGSLFTSVLAAAVVPGIPEALAGSTARIVYVCNLRPQERETEGYSVADHVLALRRHGVEPDVVVHDPGCIGPCDGLGPEVEVAEAALADHTGLAHDAARLAEALAPYVLESPAR